MNKYIFTTLILGIVVASHIAYAAKSTGDDMTQKKAERDIKKEEMIADKKETVAEKKMSKMCERVDKTIARVRTQVQSREQKTIETLEQQRMQLQENRIVQNNALQERRIQRDQQREQFYTEMMDKSQNDEQIAAVEEFKKTVEIAVAERRTAIDVATEDMRTGTDTIVEEYIGYATKLRTAYQNREETIFANAETYCMDDATEDDLKNIAQEINAQLKSAQGDFKNDISEQKKISVEVQNLVQVRNMATKQAIDDFKQVIEQARTEFKESFGLNEFDEMEDHSIESKE